MKQPSDFTVWPLIENGNKSKVIPHTIFEKKISLWIGDSRKC